MKTYRTGAIGALLDIYEQAISELKTIIEDIPDDVLVIITDPNTANEDCRSVQSILSHVLHSGFGYSTSIHNSKGYKVTRPAKILHLTTQQYLTDLTSLFAYTEAVLNTLKDTDLEQLDNNLKMLTGWSQLYDIEQLMEHAIVHILRHKRQIEKMKGLLPQT